MLGPPLAGEGEYGQQVGCLQEQWAQLPLLPWALPVSFWALLLQPSLLALMLAVVVPVVQQELCSQMGTSSAILNLLVAQPCFGSTDGPTGASMRSGGMQN